MESRTAVEWLEEQTRKPEWHSLKRQDILEKAKEMEKHQMKHFFAIGNMRDSDKYFNEHYKEKFK